MFTYSGKLELKKNDVQEIKWVLKIHKYRYNNNLHSVPSYSPIILNRIADNLNNAR